MSIQIIIIEIAIMCLLFLIMVFGMLFISPLTFISSYPPEIQAEYYRSQHKEAEKVKLTAIMKVKKIVATIAFMEKFFEAYENGTDYEAVVGKAIGVSGFVIILNYRLLE